MQEIVHLIRQWLSLFYFTFICWRASLGTIARFLLSCELGCAHAPSPTCTWWQPCAWDHHFKFIRKLSLWFNASDVNNYFNLQDAYAKYVKEYYAGTFGVSVQSYDQKYLKRTDINEDSSARLWWFQVCTEVAYFQVAPSNDSIRSSKVDTKQVPYPYCWLYILLLTGFCHHYTFDVCSYWIFFFIMLLICTKWSLIQCRYHLDLCENVFGKGTFPDVDATNLYYGGTKIAGKETCLCLNFMLFSSPQTPQSF